MGTQGFHRPLRVSPADDLLVLVRRIALMTASQDLIAEDMSSLRQVPLEEIQQKINEDSVSVSSILSVPSVSGLAKFR